VTPTRPLPDQRRRHRVRLALLCAALSATLAAGSVAGATPIYHGSRSVRTVALTFDDGYSAVKVRQILSVLVANHVPATFFPYANAMRYAASTWRAVVAAGYPVGNHTVGHPRLTGLSSSVIRYQVCGFRAVADPILGTSSIDWFRPPYGSWNLRVAAVAASCGYSHVLLWDVDTLDWSSISSTTIASRALAGWSGSIVLMHAGPYNTPYALQRIINGYRARGYQFVTIPQMLGSDG
jgi:peptidoglycan/xylan/chitin deacetylase (PgdA/CDA1 family)